VSLPFYFSSSSYLANLSLLSYASYAYNAIYSIELDDTPLDTTVVLPSTIPRFSLLNSRLQSSFSLFTYATHFLIYNGS
jgi:hypothetical protein